MIIQFPLSDVRTPSKQETNIMYSVTDFQLGTIQTNGHSIEIPVEITEDLSQRKH